jgi:hypothetical protein
VLKTAVKRKKDETLMVLGIPRGGVIVADVNLQDKTTLLASPESHNWLVCIPLHLIVFAV